jgi:hypothetical protein
MREDAGIDLAAGTKEPQGVREPYLAVPPGRGLVEVREDLRGEDHPPHQG